MCCLFGFIDYKNKLSLRQKTRLVTELAVSAEDWGTDATGIAYIGGGRLHVFKRPLPAHNMRFILPPDTNVVMGHTRMATQGNAKHNYNNHPFESVVGGTHFALAHNGVIFNDDTLRRTYKLPEGKIETDSYICVQLIRAAKELTAKSLSSMAEALLGSFTVTVLGENGALWFVRGDNPMTLYHYPELGVYVYASTRQILTRALKRIGFLSEPPVEIPLISGDILKLNSNGTSSRSRFDDSNISYDVCYSSWRAGGRYHLLRRRATSTSSRPWPEPMATHPSPSTGCSGEDFYQRRLRRCYTRPARWCEGAVRIPIQIRTQKISNIKGFSKSSGIVRKTTEKSS